LRKSSHCNEWNIEKKSNGSSDKVLPARYKNYLKIK
jgi:hypothetical protein